VVSFPQVSPPKSCIKLFPPRKHYIAVHLILLNFITGTIVGEEYRLWSSSLWSFLHSCYFAPLGPHTPQHGYVENNFWEYELITTCRRTSVPSKWDRLETEHTTHQMIDNVNRLCPNNQHECVTDFF
jgi:hypothetical protein